MNRGISGRVDGEGKGDDQSVFLGLSISEKQFSKPERFQDKRGLVPGSSVVARDKRGRRRLSGRWG